MSLISPVFLASFVVLFIILFILNKKGDVKKQNIVLLIYSICIYGVADIKFLAILIFEIILCYFSSLYILNNKDYKNNARTVMLLTVAALVVILAVFKYFNFFIDSFCSLLAISNTSIVRIIMPIGISFYSFLGISYICDAYFGKINKKPDFVTVALYISFFPAITSGPITRAYELIPRFAENRIISWESFEEGLQIFILGLFKKIVIADRLSVYVDTVFGSVNAYSGATLFAVSVAYSLQLYCDFSGYSDMAIGVARMIGIDLKKNFNLPYISKNPTEFWKRWHISLSEWLQNYLYIPLGGNRKGVTRTYINLMLTMVLGGLWHGADWKFVIWGGVHGLALVIHKLFRRYVIDGNKNSSSSNSKINVEKANENRVLSFVSIALNFIFVNFCWVLFRANSISEAVLVIKRIVTFASGINYQFVYFYILLAVIIVAHVICIKYGNKNDSNSIVSSDCDVNKSRRIFASETVNGYQLLDLNKFYNKAFICIVILIIIVFGYYGNTAFIYAQF